MSIKTTIAAAIVTAALVTAPLSARDLPRGVVLLTDDIFRTGQDISCTPGNTDRRNPEACAALPDRSVREAFQNNVIAALQTEPECAGVKIILTTFGAPLSPEASALQKVSAELHIDVDVYNPGWALKWHWYFGPATGYTTSPREIAQKVCAVVNAKGGKVMQ
jgi:hypothetical protein